MNLHVQMSWQAQRFVNLDVQISWQAQHFVNLTREMEVGHEGVQQEPRTEHGNEVLDRDNPPRDADWWDLETLLVYQKEGQEQRAGSRAHLEIPTHSLRVKDFIPLHIHLFTWPAKWPEFDNGKPGARIFHVGEESCRCNIK